MELVFGIAAMIASSLVVGCSIGYLNRLNQKRYFLNRLADPSLLAKRVWVAEELCIPLDGKRRSGSTRVQSQRLTCECIKSHLSGREGFPNVRIEEAISLAHKKGWVVAWGESACIPKISTIEGEIEQIRKCGELFGYTDESIRQYQDEKRKELDEELKRDIPYI
jgi:hypothetical protein